MNVHMSKRLCQGWNTKSKQRNKSRAVTAGAAWANPLQLRFKLEFGFPARGLIANQESIERFLLAAHKAFDERGFTFGT